MIDSGGIELLLMNDDTELVSLDTVDDTSKLVEDATSVPLVSELFGPSVELNSELDRVLLTSSLEVDENCRLEVASMVALDSRLEVMVLDSISLLVAVGSSDEAVLLS